MEQSDIYWNEPARAKILEDSDRVLREAVLELAETKADASSDDLVAELNAKLKDRFIDFEPGPDLRKYADAIVAGEFSGGGSSTPSDSSTPSGGGGSSAPSGGGDSATLDSQNGNGVAADPGAGALAPDGDESDRAVNDG